MTDSTTQGLLPRLSGRTAPIRPSPSTTSQQWRATAAASRVLDNIAPLRQAQPGITERDLWGEPAVLPGTYAVRLTVDGWVAEIEVEVRRNPWITDVTAEDLVAQHEFGVRIRDQVDAANSAVITICGVETQLEERLEGADDDESLIAAAERLRAAASAVEADIYQVRNRSNQEPLNLPIKVNNRLAKPVVDVGAAGWETGGRSLGGV